MPELPPTTTATFPSSCSSLYIVCSLPIEHRTVALAVKGQMFAQSGSSKSVCRSMQSMADAPTNPPIQRHKCGIGSLRAIFELCAYLHFRLAVEWLEQRRTKQGS